RQASVRPSGGRPVIRRRLRSVRDPAPPGALGRGVPPGAGAGGASGSLSRGGRRFPKHGGKKDRLPQGIPGREIALQQAGTLGARREVIATSAAALTLWLSGATVEGVPLPCWDDPAALALEAESLLAETGSAPNGEILAQARRLYRRIRQLAPSP